MGADHIAAAARTSRADRKVKPFPGILPIFLASLLLAVSAGLSFSPARADSVANAPAQPQDNSAGEFSPVAEQNDAQQLGNPIANMTIVPFNNNVDFGGGFNNRAFRYTFVAQPLIPFKLNGDWNLITRTALPFADWQNLVPSDTRLTGLSDVIQQFFFSPTKSSGGLSWGFGPVAVYPTATDRFLGNGQWGAGATGVLVYTQGPWLMALNSYQAWGVGYAGSPTGRQYLNQTFIQPVVQYTLPTHTNVFVSSESTYNWTTGRWLIPLQVGNQLLRVGDQLISLGGLVRYYADRPPGGPRWGLQARLTLIFPNK